MNRIVPSHLVLLFGVVIVCAWSGWQPHDRLTWWLEVLPGLAGLIVLIATYQRFRFTTLCYTLIALHICLLCVGGHYTYALVPLFDWLRGVFHWHRNHYDRLGHFAQGLVPAMIAREIFLRLRVIAKRGWLPFLVVCVCLAISAFYELIEWWTAAATGDAAVSFLATQGDVWDTQEDMLMALIGAICALIFLRPWQNRQLASLPRSTAPTL
jgi:putative membrane protein